LIAAAQSRRPSVLLVVLTFLYGTSFAFAFKSLAFAEPSGFPMFYSTGKLARYNLSELYSRDLQNAFHPLNATVGYFFHLPYEVVLLAPLSYLPQVPAYAVWSLISLLCLLGTAILLRRHFPDFNLLLPFAFAPTLSLLTNAQDTAIVTLVAAIAFDQFVRGREVPAGAVLALGLIKYPFVLPLVVIIGFRHWRVLLGFAAAAVPLLGLSFALVGSKGVTQYLALMNVSDAKENPGILTNLRGIVGVLTGSLHSPVVIVISVALVAAAAFLKAERIPLFCIGVIVTQLVSWHGHLYDAVLLIIPMAWMYRSKLPVLRWSAIVLLLATPILVARQPLGYLLAIALCGLLAYIWISYSSHFISAET
jgi:hypothetical protein